MSTPTLPPLSPDNPLSSGEVLFHAVKENHVKDGKTVLPDAIRLPCFSCNRKKYRDFPEAVLAIFSKKPELRYLHVGFVTAGDMPTLQTADGKVFWEVFVTHVPEEENYSHSEVRARRQFGEYDADAKIGSTVRAALKAYLAGKMRLIPRNGAQGRP